MKAETIILIPTYNRAPILKIALKHLNISSKKETFDICVVDNGSTDETQKVVKFFKNVLYRKENKNRFIAKALNNAFFKLKLYRRYKYLLIMANDVLVNNETVKNLIKFMNEHPKVGISGPKHYDWLIKTLLNEGLTIDPTTSLLKNCDPTNSKSGINHFHSCFIVRTDAFKQVGGFRPILFPMIYEEPDLGNRILNLGYKITPCRNSKIWHPIDLSKSPKQIKEFKIRYERLFNSIPKAYLFFRNRIIYMRLYSNLIQFSLFFFIFNPLVIISYLKMVDRNYLPHMLSGVLDGTVFAITKNEKRIVKQNRAMLNI